MDNNPDDPHHRMSINNLCNPPDPEEMMPDPDVKMAVEALENLRRSGSSSQSIVHESDHCEHSPNSEHFLDRVSNIPIVNSALRAYEQSKANSFVVKYGAETVESSVKSICRPVINKLEPQLGQLGDFACRQLDRLERHYSSFMDNSAGNSPYQAGEGSSRNRLHTHPEDSGGELRNRRVAELSSNGNMYAQQNLQPDRTPSRSRWQQVVLEAGVAAGAGVAVVSEESMNSLKYCQQWLSYASAHIERQIQLLTNYISSLSGPSSSTTVTTYSATANFLASIKKEVVLTLRKVVDIVGRYAGAGLPGDARLSVKNFILSLPGRWASLNVPILESNNSTPCSSPLLTPTSSSLNSPTILTPTEHANRVLTLANESMTMLQNVGDIFKDTVDRAEGWLQAVGMNHSERDDSVLSGGPLPHFALLPPPGPRSFSSSDHSVPGLSLNSSKTENSHNFQGRNPVQEHSSDSDVMC